jgi:TrmH RNA methyltransferase
MRGEQRRSELRVFGFNACLAVYTRRPAAIRKVYVLESRMPALREVLRHCAQARIGYRIVGDEDLHKLTGSQHHEGVCFEVIRPTPPGVATLLGRLGQRPAQLVFLDGVGNPHNLGAVLRSAAHFGVDAALLAGDAGLALSGAACRVAEGGAEVVPLIGIDVAGWQRLHDAGFVTAATVVRDGQSLHSTGLPRRIVWLIGAEGAGVSASRLGSAGLKLMIPGTGSVESLNVASATAILLGEHARQHGVQRHA